MGYCLFIDEFNAGRTVLLKLFSNELTISLVHWIPACAGMTGGMKTILKFTTTAILVEFWINPCVGMTMGVTDMVRDDRHGT